MNGRFAVQAMTTPRVFISYSLADRATAREVAGALKAQGVSVWIDEFVANDPGVRIQDAVREHLDHADAFVLLISPHSQHSHWARYEMSEVLKKTWSDPTKLVLPVLIDDAEPPGYLRDHRSLRLAPTMSPEIFRSLLDGLIASGKTSRVHRTSAGDERLEQRLADLESAAASLAEAEGDD